jgi:4-diphosphocytidyl-2-C-methyl-D-erythritol kinase
VLYKCYAKINLTLDVLGKRGDGYHDLASVVHTISLADELRIEPANEILSRVEGMNIDPGTNLVWRAARLLAARSGVRRGAALALAKRIPAAAGLGGGSSDAAGALVGLDRLWQTRLRPSHLKGLAVELGSDVPFFLRGGAALMRGRGDDLRALRPLHAQWLVLVVPPHHLPDKTARLYAALEPRDFSTGDATARAAECLERRERLSGGLLANSFERAARAVFPGLSDIWAAVERTCERRFFMSGAGPALFALACDGADSRRQRSRLEGLQLPVYAVRTVASARFAVRTAIRYA